MKQLAESLLKLHPFTKQFGSNALLLDAGGAFIVTILVIVLIICVLCLIYLLLSMVLDGTTIRRNHMEVRNYDYERYNACSPGSAIIIRTNKGYLHCIFQAAYIRANSRLASIKEGLVFEKSKLRDLKPVLHIVVTDTDLVGYHLPLTCKVLGPDDHEYFYTIQTHTLRLGDNYIIPKEKCSFRRIMPAGKWKIIFVAPGVFNHLQYFSVLNESFTELTKIPPKFSTDMRKTPQTEVYAQIVGRDVPLDELLKD